MIYRKTSSEQSRLDRPEITAVARGIFAAQPFTALLGAELTGIGEDWAEISITMQKALQQQHGYAHGGVISYLADNALTFAGVCHSSATP